MFFTESERCESRNFESASVREILMGLPENSTTPGISSQRPHDTPIRRIIVSGSFWPVTEGSTSGIFWHLSEFSSFTNLSALCNGGFDPPLAIFPTTFHSISNDLSQCRHKTFSVFPSLSTPSYLFVAWCWHNPPDASCPILRSILIKPSCYHKDSDIIC